MLEGLKQVKNVFHDFQVVRKCYKKIIWVKLKSKIELKLYAILYLNTDKFKDYFYQHKFTIFNFHQQHPFFP